MLDQNEIWTIHDSNESDVQGGDTLVFDSTTGTVKVGNSDWGFWNTQYGFPPAVVTHDGQDYQLSFIEGNPDDPNDPDKVTCDLVCSPGDDLTSDGGQCTPCGEVQGSSWTAQGGQGGSS